MTKIFVLGITGYVGGTVLQKLLSKYPDRFDVTAMVRTAEKSRKVKGVFPRIRTVIGDLDSSDLIAAESAKADIVLSMANCDHEGHIRAVYAGMAKHGGVAYLIHTSGTGILTDTTLSAVGKANQTTLSDMDFDDIRDIKEITSLPDQNLHRLVDRIVLETAPSNVKQLIVCPPLIYGHGSGPDNVRSIQLPIFVHRVLKRQQSFTVGEGRAAWNNVHVQDLGDLYILLIEEALKVNGGEATWGSRGYYFAEDGRHTWLELSEKVGKLAKAKGAIPTDEVQHLTKEEAERIHPRGPYMWGTNSKSNSTRAREQLGWTAKQQGIFDTLSEEIDLAVGRRNSKL